MTKTTNIIDNVKFTYEVSENQEGTFTPNHMRYRCVIKYNNRQYTFEYQCNPSYVKVTKKRLFRLSYI